MLKLTPMISIRSVTANPIFIRMTRRGISLRTTLWIAVGSMLFSMLFGITTALISDALASISMPIGILITTAPSFLLNALYPPVAAAFAAIAVGNDVQSEDYTMLKLTPITPQQIVRGYVFATLYQQRILYAIAIGLSFAGLFQWLGAVFSNMLSMQSSVETLVLINIVAAITSPVLTALRITGLVILASSIGVMLSLLWRQRGLASVVAATVMIIFQIIGAFISSFAYWFMFTSQDIDMTTKYIAIFSLGYGILLVILIYALAWGVMHQAQRRV